MKLTGIAETSILTLIFKAAEAGLDFPLVKDLRAVRLLHKLDYEFPPVSSPEGCAAQLATVCATRLINEELLDFAGRVINLGCGFDTRGIRHIKDEWIDVDCAEVMELRSECVDGDALSYNMIGDITDSEFLKELRKDTETVVLLEGVLDYYAEEEVERILTDVRDISSNLSVIFTAVGPLFRDVNPPILASIGNTTKIRWGLDDPLSLERLGYKIRKTTPIHRVDDIRWKPIKEALKVNPLYLDSATKVVVMERV